MTTHVHHRNRRCGNPTACDLDHCYNGHHIDRLSLAAPDDCDGCRAEGCCPDCGADAHPGQTCEAADEARYTVLAAERAAGWDPNP